VTARCLVCLAGVRGEGEYHTRCTKALFGLARVPAIELELARHHTVAQAMVGHTSLSGIQRTPSLPENEHVTMRIAAAAGPRSRLHRPGRRG
jgi:hypothetical protein